MNKICFYVIFLSLAFGCRERAHLIDFRSPFQGENFKSGETIKVQLDLPGSLRPDSVVYHVDGRSLARKRGKEALSLPSATLGLGFRQLRALVYTANRIDTVQTNVVIRSGRKPDRYTFKVRNVFPHDTSAYTQGLEFHEGRFLESTGQRGHSRLRWVDPVTGKVMREVSLDKKYFAEGVTRVGNRIIQLTWQEKTGLVYDAATLEQTGSFPYQNSPEGWGLCYDGSRLLKSDGSNRIWFLNRETYKEEGFIEIYDDKGAIDRLNELEYIDGKIFANVYGQEKIIMIDPATGAVTGEADLTGLLPKDYFKDEMAASNNVLNGIAYDQARKRLFVGGKKWPKIFEISLVRN
ncbi:glutaminyl-peptide cyclotransferase [Pedobacter yulinensis]|nr:glutaminyl-peptide cyclotransferase [Pedobacter yulinensis]